MKSFIKLTHRMSGRPFFVKPEAVDAIDAEVGGCQVRTGGLFVQVEEDHTIVLRMIENYKTNKENKSGKESF